MPRLTLTSDNPGIQGSTGSTGATGAGAAGLWLPSDQGWLAATSDVLLANGNGQPGLGALHWGWLKMQTTGVVSNVLCHVKTAGVTLTNTYLGVFSITGTLLGSSADQSTAFQSTGVKVVALSAPTASQAAGTPLLAVLLTNGTTAPAIMGTEGGFPNDGLTSSSPYRYGSYGSGLTALPGTITFASSSTDGHNHWFALS